jgi:hypothetical protein
MIGEEKREIMWLLVENEISFFSLFFSYLIFFFIEKKIHYSNESCFEINHFKLNLLCIQRLDFYPKQMQNIYQVASKLI